MERMLINDVRKRKETPDIRIQPSTIGWNLAMLERWPGTHGWALLLCFPVEHKKISQTDIRQGDL
jgi:hypothetical protein